MSIRWHIEDDFVKPENFMGTEDTGGLFPEGWLMPAFQKEVLKAVFIEDKVSKWTIKFLQANAQRSAVTVQLKDLNDPRKARWKTVGEYEKLPAVEAKDIKAFTISVEERGLQLPYSLRLELFSDHIDYPALARDFISKAIIYNKNFDIMKALLYMDILAVIHTPDNPDVDFHIGKTLLKTKTFSGDYNTAFAPGITVTQANISPQANTVEGKELAPFSYKALVEIIHQISSKMWVRSTNNDYSRYVILVNSKAIKRLLEDPDLKPYYVHAKPEVIEDGIVTQITLNGATLIKEDEYIKYVLSDTEAVGSASLADFLANKSIAIILGDQAIVEAITLPETIKVASGDFDRYKSIGVYTYRNESPVWFLSAGEIRGSGVVVIGD